MVVHFDKISDLPKKLQKEAEKQGFDDLFNDLESSTASLADVAGVQKGVENLEKQIDQWEEAYYSIYSPRVGQLNRATGDIHVLEGRWRSIGKYQAWVFILALVALILAIIGIFV